MGNAGSKELSLFQQPGLPGLVPEKPVADLLASFQVELDEGRRYVANKLPTAVQREMLQKRGQELARVLAPASETATAQVEMLKIIALWLGGYPMLAHADNAGMARSYVEHLKVLPLFAVSRAIESIKNGSARKMVKGTPTPFDPDEVPSSSRIFALAQREMQAADNERWKIEKVLMARATKNGLPEMTPEQHERVKGLLTGLASDMKRGTIYPPELRAQREEEEDRQRRQREERIGAINAARDAKILDEYDRLGLEPQYAAPGILLSPGMVRNPKKKGRGARK